MYCIEGSTYDLVGTFRRGGHCPSIYYVYIYLSLRIEEAACLRPYALG